MKNIEVDFSSGLLRLHISGATKQKRTLCRNCTPFCGNNMAEKSNIDFLLLFLLLGVRFVVVLIYFAMVERLICFVFSYGPNLSVHVLLYKTATH